MFQLPVSITSNVNIGMTLFEHGDVAGRQEVTELKVGLLTRCSDTSGAVFSVGDRSSCWCGLFNLQGLVHAQEPTLYKTLREKAKHKA